MRIFSVVALLSISLSSQPISAQINLPAAIQFIKTQNDISDGTATGNPYVVSYVASSPGASCPLPSAVATGTSGWGFTYDNALAALLLTYDAFSSTPPSAGQVNSRTRAGIILNTMATQWQIGSSGGALAGAFYEAYNLTGPTQYNLPVGPTAWYVIAAINYLKKGGSTLPAQNSAIRAAAEAALNWINSLYVGPASTTFPGYTWGFGIGCTTGPNGSSDVKSTEHHTAIFAAARLAQGYLAPLPLNGNFALYNTMAERASQFINSMYLAGNTVATGTGCGSTGGGINFSQQPTDVYFLPTLVMQNNFLVSSTLVGPGTRWNASSATVNINNTATFSGNSGYKFDAFGSWIHPETTSQAILAKAATGDPSPPNSSSMLAAISAAQNTAFGANSTGVVAVVSSNGACAPTQFGFSYYSVLGVAPTVWSYFASLLINPYYLLPSTTNLDIFGQDPISITVSVAQGGTPFFVTVSGSPINSGNGVFLSAVLLPIPQVPISIIDPTLGGFGLTWPTAGPAPLVLDPTMTGMIMNTSGTAAWGVLLPQTLSGLTLQLQAVTLSPVTGGVTGVSPALSFTIL